MAVNLKFAKLYVCCVMLVVIFMFFSLCRIVRCLGMARRKRTKVERQRTVLVTRMPHFTVINRRVACDCSQECYDNFDL